MHRDARVACLTVIQKSLLGDKGLGHVCEQRVIDKLWFSGFLNSMANVRITGQYHHLHGLPQMASLGNFACHLNNESSFSKRTACGAAAAQSLYCAHGPLMPALHPVPCLSDNSEQHIAVANSIDSVQKGQAFRTTHQMSWLLVGTCQLYIWLASDKTITFICLILSNLPSNL
jgi:hypothetical protein